MSSSMYGGQGMRGPTGSSSSPSGTGGNVIPKGYRQGQLQQFNPEQMQLFQQMFGHVGPDSYLSRLAGGDEGIFNQIEAPALRQFGQLQGNIASRFGGMGGTSGRRSSGFQNIMSQASTDFAQNLQSQRQSLQQNAIKELMGLSNELLGQRPYEQFLTKKEMPFWKQMLLGATIGANEFGKQVGGAAMTAGV